MSRSVLDHGYIVAMLCLGVYSQLIMRWQVSLAGPLPESIADKALFAIRILLTPWALSAVAATFLAGVSWMLAMTKFELSYAYPWTSLYFVFIPLAAALFFGESFTPAKGFGIALIIAGIVALARG